MQNCPHLLYFLQTPELQCSVICPITVQSSSKKQKKSLQMIQICVINCLKAFSIISCPKSAYLHQIKYVTRFPEKETRCCGMVDAMGMLLCGN